MVLGGTDEKVITRRRGGGGVSVVLTPSCQVSLMDGVEGKLLAVYQSLVTTLVTWPQSLSRVNHDQLPVTLGINTSSFRVGRYTIHCLRQPV